MKQDGPGKLLQGRALAMVLCLLATALSPAGTTSGRELGPADPGNPPELNEVSTGTAPAGSFTDVPDDHWAHEYIETIYQAGYVAGCSTDPLMYCPNDWLTRAQMAVFVLRGVHGAGYEPPAPGEQIFEDVPLDTWYAPWVNQFYLEGYTAGCSSDPLLFCPEQPHTRAEATDFFLRMLHGTEYEPPAPSGVFVDVATDTWYAGWVEAAYSAGLIPPCQTEPERRFCPDALLIRSMAAYMMVQAKGLMTPTTDLIADKLEVTQAVQDLNNSIRLVANKPTFVRFHVRSTSETHLTDARLYVQHGSRAGWLQPVNHQIHVRHMPIRSVLDHAFLFELPSGFITGTVSLIAELNPGTVQRGRSPLESSYGNNIVSTSVTFEPVPRVSLVIYRVGYQQGSDPIYPAASHVGRLMDWLLAAYPMSDVTFSIRRYLHEGGQPTCDDVNTDLTAFRVRDLAGGRVTTDTRYYGMIDDGGGGRKTSCADAIPSYVASGWTGTPVGYDDWDTDGSYGDWLGGHELGHCYGRHHAPFCGAVGTEPFPNPEGSISPVLVGDAAVYGFNVKAPHVHTPSLWTEMMTYCKYRWISDFTYHGLMDHFQDNLGDVTLARHSANQADRLLVVGTIDPQAGQVNLQPLFVLPNVGDLQRRIPGDHAIVLRNGAGAELARYACTPHQATDVDLLFITELVPYVTGTAQVDIEGPDGVLASVGAGAAEPTVTLTAPNAGETLDGDTITVSWTAHDADGDPLAFDVEYSPDDGATWQAVAQNVTGNSVEISAANVPAGMQGRFRVWVTDGIHTAGDASDAPFTVPNHAPTAEITAPDDGVTVVVSQTVGLVAYAYDSDTGAMDDGQLQWTSSIDGLLGSGDRLSTANLSEGAHTITLLADDGAGGVVSDTVEVTVVGEVIEVPRPPDGLLVGPTQITFAPATGVISAHVSIDNHNFCQAIAWGAVASEAWVQLSARAGTTPDGITATFDDTGLPVGTHTATIILTSPDVPGDSVTIDVKAVIVPYRVYLPMVVRSSGE